MITGALGFIWVAVWAALVSTPEKTKWLPEPERQRIMAEREAGIEVPDHDGIGYLALLRCPAMWGLFFSQGCLVYSLYLYLSWLPNYLQTSRGLSLIDAGLYTSVPFFIATAVNIIINWLGDRALSVHAVRNGMRRYLVALCLFLTAAGLVIPFVQSLTAVIILISITVSFANTGPATNATLTSDLLRSPGRCGSRIRIPGPWWQCLRPAGADRHWISRGRERQLQQRLHRSRCPGAHGRDGHAGAVAWRDRRGFAGGGAAGSNRVIGCGAHG